MEVKIKSMKYEDFKDNEYIEQLVKKLHEGGVNVVVGSLMKQLIGGDPIRYGLLRLQPAVAGLNLCRSGQPVMIWPVSVSR